MMDDLLKELSSLSDSDLCKELKSAGLPFGGISKSIRKFFVKRLATHRLKEKGLGNDDEGNEKKTEPQGAKGQENLPASGERKKEELAKNGQTAEQKGDPIAKGNSSSSTGAVAAVVGKGEIFYVVCIPVEGGLGQNDNSAVGSATTHISQNMEDVLKLMKDNTEARFNTFKSLEEAQNFARLQANLTTPKKGNGASSKSEQPAVNDRANNYRTPKTQQLNGLRFVIEKREAEKFQNLVRANPRYLVTSVDTPSVLHEGCKYNALHVAAMKNLPRMMRLILDTINDPEIPKLLYPGESEESRAGRWDFVTHLYLNSLEKGNGETPLHFASKFGSIKCVQILLNHPKCNKNMTNKYGETASEIICNRYRNSDKDLETVQSTIAELLDDHFYVHVWRADDNSLPAVIGEPWSPDVPNSQSALLSDQAKGSPIDSNISPRARAGPMSRSEAVDFQKDWKTPPSFSKKQAVAIRRGDSEKGLERLGRELAHTRRVPWMEYWSFLDDFVDFSETEGLEIFEDYLANRCYELTESALEEKSSVTKVPAAAAVMKKLMSEFTATSTPIQIGVGKEALTEISNSHDVDDMGAEKSKKGDMRANDMQTNSINLNPDNQSTHEQTVDKSTDARSEIDIQKLAYKLEEMTVGMKKQLERNSGATEKNLRLNAGGDLCTVNTVVSPQSPSPSSSTHNNLGQVCDELGSNETLDLTTHPTVSPTFKPVKNSTETKSSSKSMGPDSPVVAASGSNKDPVAITPDRTTTAGQMTKLLSSLDPVIIMKITNMMSQQKIGAVKCQIVPEESDADTGVSSIRSRTRDETEERTHKKTKNKKTEEHTHENKKKQKTEKRTREENPKRITAPCVASSQSNQESPVNHKQIETASSKPKVDGDSNNNTRDSDTVHPIASEQHGLPPSTTRSPFGGIASPTTQTNTIDSKPDQNPVSLKENASPERTGTGLAEGSAIGFQTPENQRLIATPPSAMNVSPGSGIFFINGDVPTKVDLHVLRAIQSTDVGDKFPFVNRWKEAMEQIPEETRQRWRTPAQSRYGSPLQYSGPSPSRQGHYHHRSPLTGGRSPVLQKQRHRSEPVNRGVGSRTNQGDTQASASQSRQSQPHSPDTSSRSRSMMEDVDEAKRMAQARANQIQVFVRKIDGGNLTLEVNAHGTVGDLQRLIQTRTNIDQFQQRLTFSGRNLDDKTRSLSSYGIVNLSNIDMNVRLRGGSQ